MIERHCPDLLVLEDPGCTRRRERFRRIAPKIADVARSNQVGVAYVTVSKVLAMFPAAARTKVDRAELLAEVFPELREILPPPRRPWMREDVRLSVFDALGFALSASRFRERT